MSAQIHRRTFLRMTAAGCPAYWIGAPIRGTMASASDTRLVSPGCRRSKVKVGRLYTGSTYGLWPKPTLDFQEEIRFYETQLTRQAEEMADVEFMVDEPVDEAAQVPV
jgi:hypothetical protein